MIVKEKRDDNHLLPDEHTAGGRKFKEDPGTGGPETPTKNESENHESNFMMKKISPGKKGKDSKDSIDGGCNGLRVSKFGFKDSVKLNQSPLFVGISLQTARVLEVAIFGWRLLLCTKLFTFGLIVFSSTINAPQFLSSSENTTFSALRTGS